MCKNINPMQIFLFNTLSDNWESIDIRPYSLSAQSTMDMDRKKNKKMDRKTWMAEWIGKSDGWLDGKNGWLDGWIEQNRWMDIKNRRMVRLIENILK